jgi:hypothetical protein
METKNCNKCGIEKSLTEFHKRRTVKSGINSICKDCVLKSIKKHYLNNNKIINNRRAELNLLHPWKRVFYNINQRCNNFKNPSYKDYGGRGILCLITEEELKELWFRDEAYNLKIPSVNRKDNDGNYIFENCEFIEKGLNSAERNYRCSAIPILQFDLNNKFIKEWYSQTDVSKELNLNISSLNACLKGIQKTAGNFIWKYKVMK